MNRIYMTFLTKNDLLTYPWLREVEGSALARHAGGYIVTNDTVVDKVDACNKPISFNCSLRPVIKSNASLIPFIEKHKTNKGDLDFKNISFGTYPLYFPITLFRLNPNSCERTGKKITLIQDGKFIVYDEYVYEDRKFIFVNNGVIELKPLKWEYNIKTNSLICKQSIWDIPYTSDNSSVLLSYIYMNYYLFKELLENYEVDTTNSIKLVDEKGGVSFDYPYNNYIENEYTSEFAMKHGYRKPSIKKSVSARTTGNVKRIAKKATNPLYDKKGMGYINDSQKAVYNKIYNKTTNPIFDNPKKSSDNATVVIWLVMLVIFALLMWKLWSFLSWLLK